MGKYIGRFYVSMAIINLIVTTADRALEKPYLWFFVLCHLGCLFFVIKDGVK